MPATVKSKTTHTALVPWTDVMEAVQTAAKDFLATHPELMLKMSVPGASSVGLTYQWSISPPSLDQLLRTGIENLPTLGLYQVLPLPASDQINALSVTWDEETVDVKSPAP